jgi:hypothetical protein
VTAERDRYKALAGELAEALRAIAGDDGIQRVRIDLHDKARAVLAKYEQEKGA